MALRHALISLAAALAAATAPAAMAQTVEGVAAVVNDEPITTLDVRDRMRLIISAAGVEATEDMLPRIQEQAMRALIEETLQLQQAREFEVEIDEAEVDAALADNAARNGATVAEIEADLAANGISIETLRRQIRAEIAWQILVSGRYRSRIRISDQQIQNELEREAAAAAQTQYRLAEIYVEIRPSDGGEQGAVQRMEQVFDLIRQGVPFPNIAEQLSDAPSGPTGGFLGWVPESALDENVRGVLAQVPVGSLTNPIRVPGGFQIMALIDKREGQVVEQLGLTQVTIPTAQAAPSSREQLERAARRSAGCETASDAFSGVPGAVVTPLGSLGANALIPAIRDALADVEPGQATSVLETGAGLQVFVLCSREIAGPGVPSIEEIEDQLIGQQLSLLARRWLRDLRAEATIETR